jgi:hypothetical protein
LPLVDLTKFLIPQNSKLKTQNFPRYPKHAGDPQGVAGPLYSSSDAPILSDMRHHHAVFNGGLLPGLEFTTTTGNSNTSDDIPGLEFTTSGGNTVTSNDGDTTTSASGGDTLTSDSGYSGADTKTNSNTHSASSAVDRLGELKVAELRRTFLFHNAFYNQPWFYAKNSTPNRLISFLTATGSNDNGSNDDGSSDGSNDDDSNDFLSHFFPLHLDLEWELLSGLGLAISLILVFSDFYSFLLPIACWFLCVEMTNLRGSFRQ